MKKYLRIIITACLTVCLAVCLGLFATACQDEKPDSFTVSVVADGKGVEGVLIQFCPVGEACLTGKTNADGNAVFALKDEGYDFTSSTEFEIHVVTGIPDGYTTEYQGDNALVVNVKDGYSATVTLTKEASVDPDPTAPVAFTVKFSSPNPQEAEPAISIAGFYEIRSAEAFDFIVGEDTLGDKNSVITYLNVGDKVKVGPRNGNTSYSFYATYKDINPFASSSPLTADAGSAYVLAFGAGQKAYFVNPAPTLSDKRESSIINVSGFNVAFTAGGKSGAQLNIGAGKSFEAATADGAAGTAVLDFDTPEANTSVTVGTAKSFEVELVESAHLVGDKAIDSLGWVVNYYGILVELPEIEGDEPVTYKVTLTSEIEGDEPAVTNVISYGTSIPVALGVTQCTKTEGDKEVKIAGEFTFTVSKNNLSHTRNFRIEISPAAENYPDKSNGDSLRYTVLIEKVVSEAE